MSSTLSNFVAIRQTRGDLLSPVEYQTIMAMIRGILDKYQFSSLISNYKQLLDHLTDPKAHGISGVDFYPELLDGVYTTYSWMTPTPLSRTDFNQQIANTHRFLELLRRIVLNDALYTKVKNPDGSVPTSISVKLTEEWGYTGPVPTTVTLTFPAGIKTLEAFVRLGWANTAVSTPPIFAALSLEVDPTYLPLVYGIDSATVIPGLSVTSTTLKNTTNDLTIELVFTGTPTIDTDIFSLTSATEFIRVAITASGSVIVLLNNQEVIRTSDRVRFNRFRLILSRRGWLIVELAGANHLIPTSKRVVFNTLSLFNKLTLLASIENVVAPSSGFAIRRAAVYTGSYDDIPNWNIVVPDGYGLIADEDGAILCDDDTTPLMEELVVLPDGYVYLYESRGNKLLDADGVPLMEPKA